MTAMPTSESLSVRRPIPSAERPVDLVHLARQTMGDRSLEREVLQLFLRQSEIYLARLQDAADAASRTAAAHTLKGSARGIGAWRVAQAAEQAEALAGASSDPAGAAALQALAAELATARAFISDLLALH
jgi:HPt (histidine-containing phosphotransfer) domain-containing protein